MSQKLCYRTDLYIANAKAADLTVSFPCNGGVGMDTIGGEGRERKTGIPDRRIKPE